MFSRNQGSVLSFWDVLLSSIYFSQYYGYNSLLCSTVNKKIGLRDLQITAFLFTFYTMSQLLQVWGWSQILSPSFRIKPYLKRFSWCYCFKEQAFNIVPVVLTYFWWLCIILKTIILLKSFQSDSRDCHCLIIHCFGSSDLQSRPSSCLKQHSGACSDQCAHTGCLVISRSRLLCGGHVTCRGYPERKQEMSRESSTHTPYSLAAESRPTQADEWCWQLLKDALCC